MRIPDDIAVLGVDNDETICRLSEPNLSSLNQNIEQGGYDVAQLIDRIIRDPATPREDVMVMPTHIVTRQSTDIYANGDQHIAEVLKYIHENIREKISVDELVALVPLSRRLLETRFKKSMGTSIYDYIIQTRIEKVAQFLCEGMSVSRTGLLRHQEPFAHVPPVARHDSFGIPQARASSRTLIPPSGAAAVRGTVRHADRPAPDVRCFRVVGSGDAPVRAPPFGEGGAIFSPVLFECHSFFVPLPPLRRGVRPWKGPENGLPKETRAAKPIFLN